MFGSVHNGHGCPTMLDPRQPLPGKRCSCISGPIPLRGHCFSAEAAGIYLDYSKNLVTGETIELPLKHLPA